MREKSVKEQKCLMVATLIEKYTDTEMAGGTCHIILDDGNYKESDVEFCVIYSKEQGDYWGEKIAELLNGLTEEEIEMVVERPYEIENYFKKIFA